MRHLGWDGLTLPIDELFYNLCRALDDIGVPVRQQYSTASRPHALLTESCHVSNTMGCGSMAAEAWVARTSDNWHGICVKRWSGDTFQFHAFYRRLREALARTNGWSGSSYKGPAAGHRCDTERCGLRRFCS
mmetsp:Transcript_20950/g.45517  ORF Transcript_20950/g.45517 Transcript_20950/m.45517 type:complete len:132 (+) Transcript_20950:547-942(+)